MLQLLVVENYAVVERLRVRFHPGLNLLTGETGSGKSIVVDALSLLLGGRASADMIRTGEPQARVAGIFDVRDNGSVRRILDTAGLETEDGELLIEREILASGKSRAFVGSRPVAVALLRELAPFLADIHGQHEQQLLFSAEAQRDLLDAFAGNAELMEQAADAFRGWRAAAAGLAELESSEQEKLRALDLWTFQRREIETASVEPEEDAALESERRVLQNVQRLEEAAATAYAALYDSPQSALALARQAARRVDELCRIDPSLEGLREHLKTADLSLQEAGFTLRDYLTRLEANPQRLEEVETRLAALDRLKRKYGASLAAVVEFLEDVRRQIAAVENAGERMEELRRERVRMAAEFEKLAAELTARRTAAARKLEKRVAAELAPLGMDRAVFRVELAAAAWNERGADSVGFLVSANPGEEPRPLEKVASGGEISRLALALKTCLAAARRVGDGGGAQRTLVFDEVDAGVGGSAAEGIGRRLKRLAASAQVLCVTHLPQIASFADHHYRVDKQEQRGRTVATVEELDAAARTREIGRMLSGQTLTPEALKHAAQLIKLSAE
jgi:DNA repair protein RecN (Recombination protein N)